MSAVLVHRNGAVVTVTLNRPDSMNALNVDLVRELSVALREVDADPDIRVVILTGAGRAFCAGLDLGGYGDDEFVAQRGTMISAYERQQDIAGLVQAIRKLRQPVIAAVNGAAAGGGLALVCAADIRVGSTAAVFAVGFLRAGYSACDIGLSWNLPRLVGVGRAHELMLTGRKFSAEEACRHGLLTEVTSPESLSGRAWEIAKSILTQPPLSVEMTKVGMWAAVETGPFDATVEFENRQQMVTALTEDRAEATASFLEKREPNYRRR